LRQAAVAQKQEFLKVSFGLILLKKSAMVSTAEKYAPEIEICVLSKDSQAQIWRSCAKKRHFGSQYERSLEGPTFSTQSVERRPSCPAAIGLGRVKKLSPVSIFQAESQAVGLG
jgi:hypothetical protein